MSPIERSIHRKECADCGSSLSHAPECPGTPGLYRWEVREYVPADQLTGAVATLVRIATLDYAPLQHESPRSLAREVLAAMGIDADTYRGQ